MSTAIAADVAKNVFEIAVSHRAGRVATRKGLLRSGPTAFFVQQPAATVLLEACGSNHHWAR